MKNVIYNIIIIVALLALSQSCQKDYSYKRNENILTKYSWEVKTFINYSVNETTNPRKAQYIFNQNNELIKIYDNNEIIKTSWNLSEDANFLTLGSNVFKITKLNKKVMSLRYGEVEIFFTPIK